MKYKFLESKIELPAVKHDTILCKPILFEPSLDNEFVWNRSDHLGFFAEKLDGVSGSGLDVDSLDVNEGTGLLGLGNSGVVGDDSVKETLSRL